MHKKGNMLHLAVYIPTETAEAITAHAKADMLPVSTFIRRFLVSAFGATGMPTPAALAASLDPSKIGNADTRALQLPFPKEEKSKTRRKPAPKRAAKKGRK